MVSRTGKTASYERFCETDHATMVLCDNDAAQKSMDIRQLREQKPKLGWLTDIRFSIFHNHRKLAGVEPLAVACLKLGETVKIVTRENLFVLTLDGARVNLIIREGRKHEGLPYQAAPEPVQLLCNEAVTLHKNQQLFWHLTEGEIRQVAGDFRSLAGPCGLMVKKGRHRLLIQIKEGKLCFDTWAAD